MIVALVEIDEIDVFTDRFAFFVDTFVQAEFAKRENPLLTLQK